MVEECNLDTVVIELTRKCNMSCGHCLRGEQQSKTITEKVMRAFCELLSERYAYIGTLVLSGGEPFMVPKAMDMVHDVLVQYGIRWGSVYVATNGKTLTKAKLQRFADTFVADADDNDMTSVELSDDEFHEWEGGGRNLDNYHVLKDLEEKFSFFRASRQPVVYGHKSPMLPSNLIGEGRSVGVGKRGTDTFNEPSVYLSATGVLIYGCNYSYETVDSCGLASVFDGEAAGEVIDLVCMVGNGCDYEDKRCRELKRMQAEKLRARGVAMDWDTERELEKPFEDDSE